MENDIFEKELKEIIVTHDELNADINSTIQSLLLGSIDTKTANAKVREYRKRNNLIVKRFRKIGIK